MNELREFLRAEKSRYPVFPPGPEMFNAFNQTPFDRVRVVLLGQDPYHGPGQAHGLCFSVRPGVPAPPSLVNIFRELQRDLGLGPPPHGCLTHWARQGVLLLNAVLSVRAHQAASHQGRGWERFTDRAVHELAKGRENLVFLLWGAYARRKAQVVDARRHLVLTAPHPSPLSAHQGFIGCGHFSAVNRHLASMGQPPIDWALPTEPGPV